MMVLFCFQFGVLFMFWFVVSSLLGISVICGPEGTSKEKLCWGLSSGGGSGGLGGYVGFQKIKLHLSHGIKFVCGAKLHEVQCNRCGPVLSILLYSAYSKIGLSTCTVAVIDMPVFPEDLEKCVNALEKMLGNKGVELCRLYERCDVVYCYSGIRLHPFYFPEAFTVNARGRLVEGKTGRKLERDCLNVGGYAGLQGCSNCLTFLTLPGKKLVCFIEEVIHTNQGHYSRIRESGNIWVVIIEKDDDWSEMILGTDDHGKVGVMVVKGTTPSEVGIAGGDGTKNK